MKRILTALFCLAGFALAQTTAPPPEGEKRQWLQEVLDLKYADANALAKLLGNMAQGSSNGLLSRGIATAQPDLHAISIGTSDPSFLKLAEEIVKRYDVPRATPDATHTHGVEIVAHILLAGPKGSSGDALPADLEPVAKQLRSVFGYTDIRLLDSALILGREASRSDVIGSLRGFMEDQKRPAEYRITIHKIWVEPSGKGNSVTLEGFGFSAKVPYEILGQYQSTNIDFSTDLSIPEGQKVVVGKAHAGTTDGALILVLSARVVE
jgi:hypothetical protein